MIYEQPLLQNPAHNPELLAQLAGQQDEALKCEKHEKIKKDPIKDDDQWSLTIQPIKCERIPLVNMTIEMAGKYTPPYPK